MSQFYSYPPTAAGSLPAGAATAANQVLEIADLDAIKASTASIDTKLSNPLPVSAASLPLPSGASTSANQATANTSLSSIDGKTPALGQALAASSVPVVLTAAQLSTLTPLSSVSVSNFPGTQPISGTVTANAGSGTFAISAATLPLPTGAATAANQTTANTSLSSIDTKTPALGQALAAASVPVVLTAAQLSTLTPLSSVTVSGTVTANAGTNLNTSLLALDSTVAKDASLTTLNTSVNTLLKPASTLAAVTTVSAVTAITNALPVGANVIGKVSIDQTTPGTTNLVALAANQSVNVAQMNGVATTMGNGIAGTGVQRVAIASDNTAFSVNAVQSGTWTVQPGNTANTTAWLVSQPGRLTANTSAYNDYTGTSVTTAAYVQLIASTSSATGEIEIFDSSGQGMILAIGAAASEVDQIYIFPGGNGRVPLKIPVSSRVSIKAKTATASVGYIMINFYA